MFYLDELDLATHVTTSLIRWWLAWRILDIHHPQPDGKNPCPCRVIHFCWPFESHPNISQKRKWSKLSIWQFNVPIVFGYRLRWYRVCMSVYFIDIYECICIYIYIYNTAQIQDTKIIWIWYIHHISFCEHFELWAAQSPICLQPFVDKPTTEEPDPHYRCANPNIQWQCQASMGKVDCPSGGVPVGVGRRLQ